MTTQDGLHSYLTITPAGSLFCGQCVAIGHAHDNPDVPLRAQCAVHHKEWLFCAGCGVVYCPGEPGRNSGHPGVIQPA